MRKIVLIAALLLVGCNFSGKSRIVLQPQKTGITTLKLCDPKRGRPLITEVWYPVDQKIPAQPVSGLWIRCPEARDAPLALLAGKKYPLIVMSHGNGGDRMNNAWIAEILAANGYIVAAMDHHGNTWNNKIAECFIKIWERPQDVSFVIDQILGDSPFSSYIDPQRIGFVGYSLGGQTGLWLAGGKISHFDKPDLEAIPADQIPTIVTPDIIEKIDFAPVRESYHDARVGAIFLMAPALSTLFDPLSLQSIQVPVYIVASEGDLVVPHATNTKMLALTLKKVAFTFIPGAASHYVFLNEVSKGGKMMLEKRIAHDAPSVDRKKIHQEIATSAVHFFDNHLK